MTPSTGTTVYTPRATGGGWRGGVDDLHNGALAFMRMVRTSRFKLVRHFLCNKLDELYDLERDPDETMNLFDSGEHAEIRAQLEAKLRAWQRSIRDPLLKLVE